MNDLCQDCCPFCGGTALKQTHCQEKDKPDAAHYLVTECTGCGALCTVDLDIELSQAKSISEGE